MNLYLDLFVSFAKIGVCTFGGGYAMLPILQRDVVEHKGWITEAELSDYYAIGQCTPGIIAVNTATFTGYKTAGNLGGILATLGVVFPSVIIIGLIAAFLQNFAHIPAIAHAFSGVRACICALILVSVLKLRKSTVIDLPTSIIFFGILLLSLFSDLLKAQLPALSFLFTPVAFILTAGCCGLFLSMARGRKQ